jgi:hypothetical protein
VRVSSGIVSKSEPALADRLDAVEWPTHRLLDDVVVVGASERRLEAQASLAEMTGLSK